MKTRFNIFFIFYTLFFISSITISVAQDEIFEDYTPPTKTSFYSLEDALKNPSDNVQSLNLNKRDTVFPMAVFKFKNLKEFGLGSIANTTIPKEIGNLQNLLYIKFIGNQFTHLPKEIGNLNKLLELTLFNNRLSELPTEIVQLDKLTTLNLDANQFTTLPMQICKIKSLARLDLRGNQIKSLPDELIQLSNLKMLTIKQKDGQLPQMSAKLLQWIKDSGMRTDL